MPVNDLYAIDGTKIQYHPERIAQLRSDPLNTYPIYVEISPAGHCNHRCVFCAVDYIGYKTRLLDSDLLINRILEMASLGVKSIMFAGEGEPLLHPGLAHIISAVGDKIDVAITTNGVALTTRFDDVLDKIKWIKVSCNAGNKETYAKIHQTKESDWERVWENLRRTCNKRKKGRTVVGIQTVILPDNIGTCAELTTQARDCGLDYIVLKPYSQHKKSITTQYEGLTYEQYRPVLDNLEKYGTDAFAVIARNQAIASWDSGKHTYDKCLSTPYLWAYIMADGTVYGCSAYLLDGRFCYGDITASSFNDIWHSDKRKASMAYVKEGLDISECRLNCRMDKVNRYLHTLNIGNPHANFV